MAEQKPVMNSTARVAKNSLVQIVGGVLSKVMGVLLVIYAARQLGTEGFGLYSFVLSLLGIFYILTDFGLGTLATRDLARDPGQEAKYFGNIFLLRLGFSLLAAAGMVGAVAALGHPAEWVKLAAVAALSLFFTSNIDTCSAIFNAHEHMEIPSMISVIATVLRVGISLGALASGADVLILLWIYSFAALLQFLLSFFLLSSRLRPEFKVDWAFWKKLLLQAYPLALANLFSVIYFRIDTVMLASMSGERAVGLYNAAYRLLEFTIIFPAYYCGAVFPVISASYQTNPQRFRLIYRRSIKYMLMASLPLALGVAALAHRFIDVLYGPVYGPCAPALLVLMWCLVLIAVNSINAPYLIVMGRQKVISLLLLASMLLNIGLNFYAIPRYGIRGAAWVTLISEMFNAFLFMLILSKPLALEFRMLRHAVVPVVAGGTMYAFLRWVLGWDLGFQIASGAVIYLGLLWILRGFDEVDRELFGRVLRPTSAGGMRVT
jgi:O-antigen/teichoic acid export membrane protein